MTAQPFMGQSPLNGEQPLLFVNCDPELLWCGKERGAGGFRNLLGKHTHPCSLNWGTDAVVGSGWPELAAQEQELQLGSLVIWQHNVK